MFTIAISIENTRERVLFSRPLARGGGASRRPRVPVRRRPDARSAILARAGAHRRPAGGPPGRVGGALRAARAGRPGPRGAPRPPCQCVRARQIGGRSRERECARERARQLSPQVSTRTEILAFTRNSQAQTQLSHSQKELSYGSRECYRYRRDSTHCVPRRRARLRRPVFQPFSRRFGLLTAAPSARPGPRRRPCRACPPP